MGHLFLHEHRRSSFLAQEEIFVGVAVKGGMSAKVLGLTRFLGMASEPSWHQQTVGGEQE